MKTAGVKKLVNVALSGLPKPYTEDVIEDVFLAIESDDALKAEYDALSRQLGKTTVDLVAHQKNIANVKAWCQYHPRETVMSGLKNATGQ